jgi:hypothetical protein
MYIDDQPFASKSSHRKRRTKTAEHLGDDTILPLARLHVNEAIELVRRDGLKQRRKATQWDKTRGMKTWLYFEQASAGFSRISGECRVVCFLLMVFFLGLVGNFKRFTMGFTRD